MFSSKIQYFPNGVKLNPSIAPTGHQFVPELTGAFMAARSLFNFGQKLLADRIVHGVAILPINQAEIPKFAPLVNLGHPGSRYFDQRLPQTVKHSEICSLPLKLL